MGSAREAAMLTLTACDRQGAWSEGHLKRILKERALDRRDAALATRLCFGVLQTRMTLDWYLEQRCTGGLKKLEPKVLSILRISLYQILYMDKIPPSAAVNEGVQLTKQHCRNPRAAGMVNGVLRGILRDMPLPLPQGRDDLETLSLQTSHPRWLVEEFAQELGMDGVQAWLNADNDQPPTTAQVNTCLCSMEQAMAELEQDGVEVTRHPWLTGCLLLAGTGDLERLSSYQKGHFYIQDAAARLAVTAAQIQPGQRVLDCCAAPGGKSFAAGVDMNNQGEIISCDIHVHKIKLLQAGANRLGLTILEAQLQSAAQRRQDWVEGFDTVLVDVPCSGLGIIRKKPDIRYKDPKPLDGLPKVQKEIVDNCAAYVRPGGVMIYATCTLRAKENQDVVTWFLKRHPEFTLEAFDLPHWGRQEGMMTFWPHIHHTDGFFVARLRKKEA
ncbi:16S rRNA (cytosine(967)-C(5))-methyltransferase RsmB [Pseudoflavonifractor sp. An85]|uniref:16S rRNA (cytosine(967)-C(5))-methyltransferase RsmB n=1 Tax=Pseudoflavonifractor sp. An85 TaxID=1965661 RepID=UPI000B39CAAB|nr:16S rRNA (cytosine(967)-C(5))-methyltransferase RsmB [Pseudoflavonifractor sp. An85]OUN25214.1 16S rRNA (cytosine(967)-C(5))-methyltransferase [Pseudoflavonifractor sp. An85]